MQKAQTLHTSATVYLVEFASGKTYVDVTHYNQSPEAHIAELLNVYRETSIIMSSYFSGNYDLSYLEEQLHQKEYIHAGLDTNGRSQYPTPLPTSLSLCSIANKMGRDLKISDAVEKCGTVLFKAAFIKALLSEPYEISPVSTVQVKATGQSSTRSISFLDISAKYELVRKVRSFMPFGLNGYSVPSFMRDFKWLIERDYAIDTFRAAFSDTQHDILLHAAYFKDLSPRKLRPIIQFIPESEYRIKTEEERDLAKAVLLSAQDLLCGYKDVLPQEPIVYAAESGSSVSFSDLLQNSIHPITLRLPHDNTGPFVPWRLYASTSFAKKNIKNFMRNRSGIPSALALSANSDSLAACTTAYGSVWRWLPVGMPQYEQYPELL